MSHELENVGVLDNLALLGKSAWHGLGTVISDNLTAVQAGLRFGLFWPVEGWNLSARSPLALAALERFEALCESPGVAASALIAAYKDIADNSLSVPTHVANVRTADVQGNALQHLLGVVSSEYQVCQNRELAEFTDALSQTGQVTIESCGSIRGGKRVWFLARGESFNVGGSDTMFPYILVSNGHDGTSSIRVTPTTVRVVCSNTLHMVIPGTDDLWGRPDTAAISIRHSGKISDKLEQAKRAMAYYGATLRRNHDLYEAMQAKRVDQQQAMKLFADTYSAYWEVATQEELDSTDAKLAKLAQNRVERMRKASDAFLTRWTDEQTKLGIGSTVWSAFNAMTGFIQHDRTARGEDDAGRVERRIESNLFGLNSTRTHEVLSASLALASS